MSRLPFLYLTLMAHTLGGCAAGPLPESATAAAVEKDRRPAAELVEMGRNAAARGDAVRAEQYLALAIEQGADRRRVMPILLRACLTSSHLRAALNHAEPFLLDHPEDDSLRYLVATIHLGLGQVAAARRELGLLLQRDGSNADAHYLLGILDAAGDIETARAHFQQASAHSKDEGQRTEIRSRLAELQLRAAQARDELPLPARRQGGRP
jgi:tetratricopeptide (TPR) repeat protein